MAFKYQSLLACCKRVTICWSGPYSCISCMAFKSYTDCRVLYFMYWICSRILCL